MVQAEHHVGVPSCSDDLQPGSTRGSMTATILKDIILRIVLRSTPRNVSSWFYSLMDFFFSLSSCYGP